ncbi:hypothetical protein MKX01_038488 [Papaver californicum]|nr:hypothetical protein MKX01_038488 [Papaver californicum]
MSIYRSLCLLQSTPISSNKSPLPHQFTKFSNSLCTFTGLKLSVVMNKGMLFSTNAVSTEDFAVNVGEDLPQNYGDWFPEKDVKDKRRAGILLHPTSLHGNYEIGDLGDEVFKFLDWLHDSGCSVWQFTERYISLTNCLMKGRSVVIAVCFELRVVYLVCPKYDANYGNTLLISLENLVKDGLLNKNELPKPMDADRVKFEVVANVKDPLIAKDGSRMQLIFPQLTSLNTFTWNECPEPLKNRHISKGIKIMGDMPIYVGYHSAYVWENKKQYLLNMGGFPVLVSGVPPDAFSETGQLWDSPLYDWKEMEAVGFSWWVHRIVIAMFGKWKAGPKKASFDAIFKSVGKIDIVAEDLGVITEDVFQLRKAIGAPGMAVLQFENPHFLHNHESYQVVYTDTHDNDTVRCWWENLKQEDKSSVLKYFAISEGGDISWTLVRVLLSSVARTAIIPMQDILSLGSSARMNVPATHFGNWSWRLPSSLSFDDLEPKAKKLRDILSMYRRVNS